VLGQRSKPERRELVVKVSALSLDHRRGMALGAGKTALTADHVGYLALLRAPHGKGEGPPAASSA